MGRGTTCLARRSSTTAGSKRSLTQTELRQKSIHFGGHHRPLGTAWDRLGYQRSQSHADTFTAARFPAEVRQTCAHFMGRRKTCAVPVYVLWVLPPPRLLLPAAARVAMSSMGTSKDREKDWDRVPCWVAATMPTGFCMSRGCSQIQTQQSRRTQPCCVAATKLRQQCDSTREWAIANCEPCWVAATMLPLQRDTAGEWAMLRSAAVGSAQLTGHSLPSRSAVLLSTELQHQMRAEAELTPECTGYHRQWPQQWPLACPWWGCGIGTVTQTWCQQSEWICPACQLHSL